MNSKNFISSNTQSVAWYKQQVKEKTQVKEMYEAQQICEAGFQRYIKLGRVEEAMCLLDEVIVHCLIPANCLEECEHMLKISGVALQSWYNSQKVTTTVQGRAQSFVESLVKLYGLWTPRSPINAANKLSLLRNLLKFSEKINEGPPNILLHKEAAHTFYAIRDYKRAVQQFAYAGCPEAAALVIQEWISSLKVPDSEVDLLVTRCILEFLTSKKTVEAATLREYFAELPKVGKIFKVSPLYNFTEFITSTLISTTKTDCDDSSTFGSKADKDSANLALVNFLIKQYAPLLEGRDPELATHHLAHVKLVYFGIQIPKASVNSKQG